MLKTNERPKNTDVLSVYNEVVVRSKSRYTVAELIPIFDPFYRATPPTYTRA